jgi:hypothetical protein
MYTLFRDGWRVYVSALLGLVCFPGLAVEAATRGDGFKAAGWVIAALVSLGLLVAPWWLARSAKRRAGPPGRHESGRVKY